MNGENSRKIKLLKLWELLKNETDESNPMDTVEIIDKLSKMGIDVDRKILYSDIELLNKYGFEVLKERSKRNRYYVMDRSFNLPEVRILMDAVQASGFITEKKTEELIDKIASLAGSKRGEALKENIVRHSTVKSNNESIFYSVDTIISAIESGKKISFYYFSLNIKGEKLYRTVKDSPNTVKQYTVNPVYMVLDNDQYYLVCYDDKHMTPANYRIDRMDRVKITDEDITKNSVIESLDLAEHTRQMFGMYSGEVERVAFDIDRSLLDVVYDRFGSEVSIYETKDKAIRCKCNVQTGQMFIAWCCSFGKRLRVVSPPTLVKRVKQHLEDTIEAYK